MGIVRDAKRAVRRNFSRHDDKANVLHCPNNSFEVCRFKWMSFLTLHA